MNPYADRIRALRETCATCLDFDRVNKELAALQNEIATAGEVSQLDRDRATLAVETARKNLADRQVSAPNLIEALARAQHQRTSLSQADGTGLIAWFFKVIHADNELTAEMEGFVRPLIAQFQSDAGANKQRIEKDFSKYSLLAEMGPNPDRSERNLRTLRVALRLSILPFGFSDDMIQKCDAAIELARKRATQSQRELLKESFEHCRAAVNATWRQRENDNGAFLEQGISNAIHISLYSIADAIAQTEDAVEDEAAFGNELNEVLGRFAAVRFPSSTTIFLRFRTELDEVRQRLEGGSDFPAFRAWLGDIRNDIKASQKGRWGIDRMQPRHVTAALAEVSEIVESVAEKEMNPLALDGELRLLEDQVNAAVEQQEPVSAGLIKRLGQRVRRDSSLVNWDRNIL